MWKLTVVFAASLSRCGAHSRCRRLRRDPGPLAGLTAHDQRRREHQEGGKKGAGFMGDRGDDGPIPSFRFPGLKTKARLRWRVGTWIQAGRRSLTNAEPAPGMEDSRRSMIEHELGGIQQGPDEVLVRLGVRGGLGNEFEKSGEFLCGRLAGETADEKLLDRGGGRSLGLDVFGERAVACSRGWMVSPTERCKAWETVGADLVSVEETLPRALRPKHLKTSSPKFGPSVAPELRG